MNTRREQYLLFRVYQHRDTHAFGELYDAHYVNVRRYLLFRLPTSQDADELAAEVFLRAWEYATATRVQSAAGFFYQLARRLTADFYRQRERRAEEESLAEAERLADDWAKQAEVKELISELLTCLLQL
jgi:DNA-directed RNA polymerase specialized sigma24 family protein